jgi:hypothetical protein
VSIANPESDLVNTDFFSMGSFQPDSLIADLAMQAGVSIPEGTELDPTLGSGYWLMVSGLSSREHTLTFGGAQNNGFSVSVTDHITIGVPEPAIWMMLGAGFIGLAGISFRIASLRRRTLRSNSISRPAWVTCAVRASMNVAVAAEGIEKLRHDQYGAIALARGIRCRSNIPSSLRTEGCRQSDEETGDYSPATFLRAAR